MCPIPNSFRDRAIALYGYKIVDKKEILRTVSNTAIYCSSDKVGTVYLVWYIFEKSTVNINGPWDSCENMVYCASVQCTVYCTILLLRMTDTLTSQYTDLSSRDTLYNMCRHISQHLLFTFDVRRKEECKNIQENTAEAIIHQFLKSLLKYLMK
jgi:hypothetical protein